MDVSAECNKLLKTASCLVLVIGEADKSVAKVRISELRANLNNLEQYIQEKEKENGTTH